MMVQPIEDGMIRTLGIDTHISNKWPAGRWIGRPVCLGSEESDRFRQPGGVEFCRILLQAQNPSAIPEIGFQLGGFDTGRAGPGVLADDEHACRWKAFAEIRDAPEGKLQI